MITKKKGSYRKRIAVRLFELRKLRREWKKHSKKYNLSSEQESLMEKCNSRSIRHLNNISN